MTAGKWEPTTVDCILYASLSNSALDSLEPPVLPLPPYRCPDVILQVSRLSPHRHILLNIAVMLCAQLANDIHIIRCQRSWVIYSFIGRFDSVCKGMYIIA